MLLNFISNLFIIILKKKKEQSVAFEIAVFTKHDNNLC